MMPEPWTLTVEEHLFRRLHEHLFQDNDEHGAVIAAGVVETDRGSRLLAREVFLAQDGTEFVPGRRGYRMLTAEFVSEKIRYCRDQGLSYLAVHNHRGLDSVEFSGADNASHERGYPALLDISGRPVGALVLAENAVAGDIWTPDRVRRSLSEVLVVGRNLRRLYPSPPPPPPSADYTFDRQVRWFGDRGQHRLGRMKVGVVGAGGVGLPLITMLGRLGVGTIVVVDPDRVEDTNLPRLPEATQLDAMMPLRKLAGRPDADRHYPAIARIADRLSASKIRLAKRAIKRANPRANFVGIMSNVATHSAAKELIDCDYMFLAADSHLARMVTNAIAHQFLIPMVQIGTRIDVHSATGSVGDIRTNIRPVLPGTGCLRCNQLISPSKIQEESVDDLERERSRYVDEVPAPSVITFNTWAASRAATDFLLMAGCLLRESDEASYLRYRPRNGQEEPVTPQPNKPGCRDCGSVESSRRARGSSVDLPLPDRAP